MQFLIRWVADTNQLGEQSSQVLRAILDTDFSPELIPAKNDGEPFAQKTEDIIGPYELQDFTLYYTLRFGYAAFENRLSIVLLLERSGSGPLARYSGA